MRSSAERTPAGAWVPLRVHSHFSFLDSTLSPTGIAEWAVHYGYGAVGLTDPGLHGAVPVHQALRAAGVKAVIGVERVVGGAPLLLFAENAAGYTHLCRWLTARDERPAGAREADVLPEPEGLLAVGGDPALAPHFAPGSFFLGAAHARAAERWARLRPDLPVVAAPRIHHAPGERRFHAILQSMRTLTRMDSPHPDKRRGDFAFPSPAEIARRFPGQARALARAGEIAARCAFTYDYSRLHVPAWTPPDGSAPAAFLAGLAWHGLRVRYGRRAHRHRAQVEEELRMIAEVGYAEYFLAVWELLQDCRARGIEWITRGSAADSLVCYCLGISDVCPVRFDLYFRRFLNRERMALNKLPDIDLDFAHDRRDEVVAMLFRRFGQARTAVVGGFSTFQARSAFAEIAKTLGVSEHQVRRVTEKMPRVRARDIQSSTRAALEFHELPLEEEPYRTAFALAARLDGVPRHAKQHPCGVVVGRGPLHTLLPCFRSASGLPTTHGDMDAVEALGLVKMDLLSQGGLAVMRDTLAAVRAAPAAPTPEVTSPDTLSPLPPEFRALAPWDDPAVWDLIASGQGRGVHHIESPAMLGLAQGLQCRDIDTLVAMVSVIRPGAANEHKKRRFLLRHQGLEPADIPHPSLAECLGGTYGLVIYEEQILQIGAAFAGLDPGRADLLRRALVKGDLDRAEALGRDFAAAARARGRSEGEIQTVWELVRGFHGYAFCKAHSAAYGVEAYHAAWLKLRHPAVFLAAVLEHGKGFYDPLVYTLECRRLGIGLAGPDLNGPARFTVEPGPPPRIRVPLSRIAGLSARTLARTAEGKPFAGVRDFVERVRPARDEAEALLRAGAFDAFAPSRVALFWELQAALPHVPRADAPGPPATSRELWTPAPVRLPPGPLTEPTRRERLFAEGQLLGFTVSGHPLELYEEVDWARYQPVCTLGRQLGRVVTCCGLVVEGRTTHQITGETMKFMTIADPGGMVETELFAEGYRRHGLATVRHPVLEVTGVVEPFVTGHGHTLRILRAGPPRHLRAPAAAVGGREGIPANSIVRAGGGPQEDGHG
jgi:error-prone DNA polymerase